jgi:DnaJ-class molecular chaperone
MLSAINAKVRFKIFVFSKFISSFILGRGGKKGAVSKCTTCHGSGFVVRINQIAPGMIQQMRSHCSDCNGQGEKINPKDKCKTCDGKKINRERKIIEVHIDKGNEQKIKKDFLIEKINFIIRDGRWKENNI